MLLSAIGAVSQSPPFHSAISEEAISSSIDPGLCSVINDLPVYGSMKVVGYENIYAAGDCCSVMMPTNDGGTTASIPSGDWFQMKLWSQVW